MNAYAREPAADAQKRASERTVLPVAFSVAENTEPEAL